MATFSELQATIQVGQQRAKVLAYLVEHLDTYFMPGAEGVAVRTLLSDDKVVIPPSVFAEVIDHVLHPEIEKTQRSVDDIMQSNYTLTPPAVAAR